MAEMTTPKPHSLFEYAIIRNVSETEMKAGKKPEIICSPKVILAPDEKSAYMQAVRSIPAEHDSALDQIQVALRPF